jgi:hypothetical protein
VAKLQGALPGWPPSPAAVSQVAGAAWRVK